LLLHKHSSEAVHNQALSDRISTGVESRLKASKAKIKMIYKREWEAEIIEEYLVLVRTT